MSGRITELLRDSDVAEMKWQRLASAKARLCAAKLVELTFDVLLAVGGRLDVLVWDTHDSRHTIQHRDDRANWERMFFHLHHALMGRRPRGSVFHLLPDEGCETDWQTVADCLAARGRWRKLYEGGLGAEEWSDEAFSVGSLATVDSRVTPLCQLADLYAGMAPYTRTKPELMKHLFAGDQGSLFPDPDAPVPSASDRERFPVIRDVYERSRSRRLGVSLRTKWYLDTPDPRNPVNFWHYVPQHLDDRAPTYDMPAITRRERPQSAV